MYNENEMWRLGTAYTCDADGRVEISPTITRIRSDIFKGDQTITSIIIPPVC